MIEGPGNVQETNPKFHALNRAIVQLVRLPTLQNATYSPTLQIEDHPLVAFLPLDLTDSDSLEYVLSSIDFTMQYGEDEEPKEVGLYRLHGVTADGSLQPADLDEGDFADADME